MAKTALITGITGQDGSYLAELLLDKGYQVHGLIRRASTFNTDRIDGIYQDPHESGRRLSLHYGDLQDGTGLVNLIRAVEPDEVYHLGAQSHVKVSFEMPEYTGDTTGLGTMRLLEAIRASDKPARFYQASSSELYGSTPPPQSELTPFHPRSPYSVAKLYGFWAVVNYREAYGMHATNGILFNHESPRRGETFLTRKVTRAVARTAAGDDYVLATGHAMTVRDFCVAAFSRAGLDWEKHVDYDPRYDRPSEVDALIGDAGKAEQNLRWKAQTYGEDLVKIMVEADIQAVDDQLSGRGVRIDR